MENVITSYFFIPFFALINHYFAESFLKCVCMKGRTQLHMVIKLGI